MRECSVLRRFCTFAFCCAVSHCCCGTSSACVSSNLHILFFIFVEFYFFSWSAATVAYPIWTVSKGKTSYSGTGFLHTLTSSPSNENQRNRQFIKLDPCSHPLFSVTITDAGAHNQSSLSRTQMHAQTYTSKNEVQKSFFFFFL